MSKVRILGPRDRLSDVLPVLQDFGRLHLTTPHESDRVRIVRQAPAEERRERRLLRIRRAVHLALEGVGRSARTGVAASGGESEAPERATLAAWARLARRVVVRTRAIRRRRSELQEEQALLTRYRHFFGSFRELADAASRWPEAAAYHVVLPDTGGRAVELLREGLRQLLGQEFELWSRRLDTGETGAVILVAQPQRERLEELFRASRVQEVRLPGTGEGGSPADAIPRIAQRLERIPGELEELDRELGRLASRHAATLLRAEAALMDELARIEVAESVGATDHAFVLEGWLPTGQRSELSRELAKAVGDTTVMEEVSREEWVGEDVPVVLQNPRLFRPFETLISILPLPRYGSIDPTPFLAIFFPMFFGIVLGDVGYGAVLGAVAAVLALRSEPDTRLRAVAEIAGACAAFTIVFGALYGELFGDLGARLFGMQALAFRREDALLPFLGLALAIGVVHILLGLLLNLITGLREGARAAIGPGVTLLMVILVVLAILAAVDVLPGAFFTPSVLLILALFPALVLAEGILGPTELLTTLGHILSYARVMAVGTASVMMAVAANRMVGAMGSVVVGSLFALLFHLVNFALGVFSPTVHALRLHFVEFFGTFYSPGGTRYRPFGHWASDTGAPFREE